MTFDRNVCYSICFLIHRVQFLEVSTSYQYTIGICEKARVDLTEAKFEKAGVVQQNITDHQTPYLLGRIDSASVVAGSKSSLGQEN